MSRLRLKDEPVSCGVQTFMKLALFFPHIGCFRGRALRLTLIIVSAEEPVFAGSVGAWSARPAKARSHFGIEQSSLKRIPMSGVDSIVAKIPTGYNQAERREILFPICLIAKATCRRCGSAGLFVILAFQR